MPSKKKKYNARFPPARIKKIMQSDEEVGKVAQAVPVIISRALELFVESLLKKAESVTQARNAKTLTPSHLKQCISSEQRFDFLKDLVSSVPDVQGEEDLAETPTPHSSASNQVFSYPTTAAQTQQSNSKTPSALGAPPPGQHINEDNNTKGEVQNHQGRNTPQHIAEYAQDLPQPPPQHTSVIVSPQQQGYILNPAGVTGNPYIPNISGGHPGLGIYAPYSHPHPNSQYMQNPNGITTPTPQGHSVIQHGDKSVSNQYHHQQPH